MNRTNGDPGAAWRLIVLALWLTASPLAADGVQTGRIAGVVVDADGEVLPGVDVALAGARSERLAVTDDAGRFRFPQLDVGSYQVSADLLGLRATAAAVRVYIDTTTDVELQLLPESGVVTDAEAREQIQVLAVAPLIDRYETAVRTSVSRQLLEQLPVQRFYQSVALLLPGVVGGEDGNPNTSGALRGANQYLVDGVDTTDPTTGLFGLNLTYDAIDDVEVTTAAPTVAYGRRSGATINVVTARGGERYRGGATWLAAGSDWRSDYRSVDALLEPEISTANQGTEGVDATFSLTLGGPLVAERLWFFGAFEDGEASLRRPTVAGQAWDEDVGLSSAAFKLDADLGAHALTAQYTSDDASFGRFTAFDRAPSENRAAAPPERLRQEFILPFAGDLFAIEERSQRGDFAKLDWRWVAGQNTSITGRLATQDRRLSRQPRNRRSRTAAPHLVPTRFFFAPGENGELTLQEEDFALFNGITDSGRESRERRQANLALDLFRTVGSVDHEIRAGLDVERTRSRTSLDLPGTQTVDRATGRPVSGQLFLDADFRDACRLFLQCQPYDTASGDFQPLLMLNFWQRPERSTEIERAALFIDDSLSFGRWLVSFGVRYEQVEATGADGDLLVDDASLAPRLAMKYDPVGDGSVLLTAVLSRFHEPFPQRLFDDFERLNPFTGYTEHVWAGLEFEECAPFDPRDVDSLCWVPTQVVDFEPLFLVPANPQLDRSAVDELVLGFERQLTRNTALRIDGIERRWRDLWDDRLSLDLGTDGDDEIIGTLDNLDEAERTYRAVQMLLRRRYADRWQLLGSYTWSRAEGNLFRAVGRSSFADFTELTDINEVNRQGRAPYDRRHQLKMFASYRQPLGRADLTFGSAIRFEDGVPYQIEQSVEGGILFLTPRGSLETDDSLTVDLSAALEIPLPRDLEVRLKLELFNVTDEQEPLDVETDAATGRVGLPRNLDEVQRPRRLRLTAGFRF